MKNIGSITAISYVPISEVSEISLPDANEKVDITFNPGKSFSAFAFSPESAQFNEEQQGAEAGPYFSQSLSFRIPKVSATTNLLLKLIADVEMILKITDGNGLSVVMGTLDTPARCSWKIMRPSSPGGYNGYEVTFRCITADPAPLLDESFEVS